MQIIESLSDNNVRKEKKAKIKKKKIQTRERKEIKIHSSVN